MAQIVKCERCLKPTSFFAFVLWTGPRGFRRYRLCPTCESQVNASKKKFQVVGGTK